MEKDKMSEEESLQLISQMINKAKNSYHDSGTGPILWGSVITLCSLVTFFRVKYQFELPFDIWLLTLIAIVPQVLIVSREKKMNKARSYDETMMDYVWIIHKLNPVFKVYIDVKGGRPDFDYGSFTSSFFLLLYGLPTIITGGCRKFKPMLYGGVLCWICCIISVYTKFSLDMLLTAIAAIGAWLVPGIILRNMNKKRNTANV
jgi:uncharacterized protein with PQ loop repeat